MKFLKVKFGLFSLLAILAVSVFLTSCEQENLEDTIKDIELSQEQMSIGERIINDYMEEKRESLGVEVRQKGSQAYLDFLFEVHMGGYPDLMDKDSDYIKSPEDLDAVLDFIMEERAPLYNNYPADDIQDGKEAVEIKEEHFQNLSKGGYDRNRARDYAMNWAYSRNGSNYPDFEGAGGGGDCTNFVSQAIHAGGIEMKGSGDGCKHEVNSSEWYVNKRTGFWPCFGNWSNWEWSTPWATTWPFRNYHAYKAGNATVPGWTTSAATADAHLGVGDVVQLQHLTSNGWSTYHVMIVTEDIYRDLKVTYHSNDTRNRRLGTIWLGSNNRFMLVKFK